MKITALLILLVGTLMLIGLFIVATMFLALSFEPWVDADPATRFIRVGVIAFVLGFLALMVFGWRIYYLGDYARITPFAYVFLGFLGLSGLFYLGVRYLSRNNVDMLVATEVVSPEDSLRMAAIPPMHFFRENGTSKDTLTVHPNGLVTYHLVAEDQPEVHATVGQFNATRDAFRIEWQGEGKLSKEAYDQFRDDRGEPFSRIFNIPRQ
jgi:hypothetical protein